MNNTLPKPGERVPKAATFIPHAENLLDVGCGDGVIKYFIKNKINNVYGIDNDAIELRKAEKKGILVKRVDFDKEEFPFKNNFFDVVTCLDVIEHVLDPKKMLMNIYRTLKKDGILIISTPNIRFSDHIYTLVVKGFFPKTSLDPSLYDGGHIHFFTYNDMHSLLEAAGFTALQDEEIINKEKRGWKGRLIQSIVGKKNMREFRTPGILIIAKK